AAAGLERFDARGGQGRRTVRVVHGAVLRRDGHKTAGVASSRKRAAAVVPADVARRTETGAAASVVRAAVGPLQIVAPQNSVAFRTATRDPRDPDERHHEARARVRTVL